MPSLEKMELSQLENEVSKKIKGKFEYHKSVLQKEIDEKNTELEKLNGDKTKNFEAEIAELKNTINELEESKDAYETEAKKNAIVAIKALEQDVSEVLEDKTRKTFLRSIPIKTPLTMIALFVTILELAALGVLPQLLKIEDPNKTLLDAASMAAFMKFIIWFPVFVVSAFFLTLLFNRNALYAPSDFKDENHFMELYKMKKQIRELNRELKAESGKNIERSETIAVKVDDLASAENILDSKDKGFIANAKTGRKALLEEIKAINSK